MNNPPCIYKDEKVCYVDVCTSKCSLNINHKREDNDDKKINRNWNRSI